MAKAKAKSGAAPCPGCGFPGGRQACQDVFNDAALRVRALAWTGSLQTWRQMHDVYAIQHAEDRCADYGQFVMHLGGLCVALEHNGAERSYRALQKFSERDEWKAMPFPPADLPASRGVFTAVSLEKLDEPMLLMDGVDRWARAVWVAVEALHPAARDWVARAHAQAQAQSQ